MLCVYLLLSSSSDKDVPDATDVEPSMVGLQNYWDDSYSEDRTNFQEQGHAGEIWWVILEYYQEKYSCHFLHSAGKLNNLVLFYK